MASSIQPKVTTFMKGLTQAQKDAFLKEVNAAIESAERGLNEIRRVIDRDPNVKFKNFINAKFPIGEHSKIPNFIYWMDETISAGWNSIFPEQLKPSNSTISAVSKIYNDSKYGLNKLEKVGEKSIGRVLQDNGTINEDREIIVVNDEHILVENFKRIFYTNYNDPPINFDIDEFTLKAFGLYVWQYLYGVQLTNLGTYISKYIDTLRNLKVNEISGPYLGYYNFESYLYFTPIGKLAILKAIRDKINGYTVGSDTVEKTPSTDSEEGQTEIELRSKI